MLVALCGAQDELRANGLLDVAAALTSSADGEEHWITLSRHDPRAQAGWCRLDRRRRGNVRHLQSARAQIALAQLTIERPSGTTRHQLAETLWPNDLPSAWESALRSVVSRVRAFVGAALPEGVNPVSVQSGHYVLSLPDDLVETRGRGSRADAHTRRLPTRNTGTRGRGRHGVKRCRRRGSRPRRRLISRTRDRRRPALDAIETASIAALALDEHGDALRLANEAARLAPLRESAHRCGINAHVAAGNRAAALRTYHELRKVLADEFGVDPSPETEDAYLALLGDVAGSPNGAGVARRRRAATFVGRTSEWRRSPGAWAGV